MTAESVIDAIEALHSPARHDYGYMFPRCDGCDVDGWEAEAPMWPCRTAAILWPDPDEQAALIADWHEWADPKIAEAKAAFVARSPFIPQFWANQIRASLDATAAYKRPGEP